MKGMGPIKLLACQGSTGSLHGLGVKPVCSDTNETTTVCRPAVCCCCYELNFTKCSFQFSFHFNRGLCDFVYNSIACHDICIWLKMLHKINEALLLNNVWWVQALDNELKDYFIHTCLGHSSSLPQLGLFEGWGQRTFGGWLPFEGCWSKLRVPL